jgi:hypothetical protein
MEPTTTVKRTFMSTLNLARIGALVAVGSVAFALAPAGCIGGWDYSGVPEGDRCNPYDSHNECGSGLQCTVSSWQVANQGMLSAQGNTVLFLAPGAGTNTSGAFNVLEFCPENYCCPVDSSGNLVTTAGTNAFCLPGCAGGAASICKADSDPGACAFAGGASLQAAMALDADAGAMTAPPSTPDDASPGD